MARAPILTTEARRSTGVTEFTAGGKARQTGWHRSGGLCFE